MIDDCLKIYVLIYIFMYVYIYDMYSHDCEIIGRTCT